MTDGSILKMVKDRFPEEKDAPSFLLIEEFDDGLIMGGNISPDGLTKMLTQIILQNKMFRDAVKKATTIVALMSMKEKGDNAEA